jgi:murein DD-endopeptidase MepM/ murein hydrolase activator NlpD
LPKRLPSPRFRLARIIALISLPLFGAIAAFGTAPETQLLLSRTAVPEPLAIDFNQAVLPPVDSFIREERFQRGDTLASLFSRLGISSDDAQQLVRSHGRFLNTLRAGTTVHAEVGADGSLYSLNYTAGKDTLASIDRQGNGFRTAESRIEPAANAVHRSGVIRSSLFAAADSAGLPDAIAMQMAEVFGADIDFHRDLRKGDRFSVIYEVMYHDGLAVRPGRLLAAEFVNGGKSYRAVWYPNAEGGKGGYFTPDGKNLRKAFLRSPLEFSRVSSGFGMRMHPIKQEWRAHRGIDYAAPSGTRIRSVGDGVVEFAGPQGGYGNMVVLRHNGQLSTAYAHLSRVGPGVRRGARIGQGDTVGFVGQTGWATGPHLHFEFRVGNEARNPLAISLPPAQPVAAQELPAFRKQTAHLAAQLNLIANSNLALLQ